MSMTPSGHFAELCREKKWDEIIDLVRAHPELANSKTQDGMNHFNAIIQSNRRDLVTAFLDAGADPLDSYNPIRYRPFIHMAASGYNQSLEAMLSHPSADVPRLLSTENDLGDNVLNHALLMIVRKNPRAKETDPEVICAHTLLDHGASPDHSAQGRPNALMIACMINISDYAPPLELFTKLAESSTQLEARYKGYTPLLLAMREAPYEYSQTLLNCGADLLARLPTGEAIDALPRLPTVDDMHIVDRTEYERSCRRIQDYRTSTRMKAKVDAERLSTAELRKIYIDADGHATRRLLNMLGADEFAALAPKYWKPMRIPEDGIAFANELRASLPPHLANLQARIDTSGLLREASVLHEDSISVSYIKGAVAERRQHV